MSDEYYEQKAQLYKKLNAFRADVIQCDWKDDKMVSLGGTKGYPYLSSDKIIKNLAPLLVKHGIELDVEYSDLTNHDRNGGNHWTIKATVFLTDVDTGFTTKSCAYGEGQDSQDKGVAKAQTAAFKKCLSARNMIADGIDPDAVDITPLNNYYKKSAEEQEEVKSKVLANAIKPTVKEEVKVEVKTEPKEEPTPVQTTLAETKTETKFVPMGPQKGAIDKILADYEAKARNGEMTPDEYHKMVKDYSDLKDAKAAVEFIRKYRV